MADTLRKIMDDLDQEISDILREEREEMEKPDRTCPTCGVRLTEFDTLPCSDLEYGEKCGVLT